MFIRMFSSSDAWRSPSMPGAPFASRSADQAMTVSGVLRSWVIAEKSCCLRVSSSLRCVAIRLKAMVSSAISSFPRTGMGSESLRCSTARAARRSSRRGRAILALAKSGDGDGHREAGPDGEKRHEATLLVERFCQGSSPV